MNSRTSRFGVTSACLLLALAGQARAQCDGPDTLIHGDPVSWDHNAVAMAMDGQYLLTGANFKTTAIGIGAGEVYGWAVIGGSAWGQAAHFIPVVGGSPSEYFGSSIGMGGGHTWAVVGANGASNNNGKVYFFKHDINTNLWGQFDSKSPGLGNGAHFGKAVAMNKAGTIAVVAAAPYADITDLFGTTLGGGMAMVYARNGNTWDPQGDLRQYDASLRHNYDYFGMSVAADNTTIVTGTPNADTPAHANCGCIHIWTRDASNFWTANGEVYAPDAATDAGFGSAVAINGNTIAVGAPNTLYAGQTGVGTVYLYRFINGNWVNDGQVNPIDAGHGFGSVISISGDKMVVGSTDAIGKAYLFKRVGAGQWVLDARYKAPTGASTQFGYSVAIEGSKIVVGDYAKTIPSATESGAAYMYDAPTVGGDSCGGATTVTQGTYNSCTYNATVDGYSTCGTGSVLGPDVWFKFTAAATGSLTIDTQGSVLDTVLSVHSGCPGVVANAIACNDDFNPPERWSKVTIPVVAGSNYLIRVAGYGGETGEFTLNIGAVAACYANCDGSTGTPRLTANDFTCFINAYASNAPYANCDGSTGSPVLTANDFTCFINAFAGGCS